MAASRCYCPVSHVIFDCDGTLMDTEGLYLNVVGDTLAPYGITYTPEDQARYMGRPSNLLAESLVRDYNLPISTEDYIEAFNQKDHQYMTNVSLLPGVKDLILHLHSFRIPMAIATSSSKEIMDVKFETHKDIKMAFHHIVCGNDPDMCPGRGKPAPDIYLLAASRFTPPPDPRHCLVFEDSPTGLKAGRAAGMQVVFIPENATTRAMGEDPTMVLGSMSEFEPELFGLPAYDSMSYFQFG
ncbi:hypothetical protein KR026_005366 [Drosophila bipectinata]|nr:hypothetical protein KR026_005366 [Drosophila bipectinata]